MEDHCNLDLFTTRCSYWTVRECIGVGATFTRLVNDVDTFGTTLMHFVPPAGVLP